MLGDGGAHNEKTVSAPQELALRQISERCAGPGTRGRWGGGVRGAARDPDTQRKTGRLATGCDVSTLLIQKLLNVKFV